MFGPGVKCAGAALKRAGCSDLVGPIGVGRDPVVKVVLQHEQQIRTPSIRSSKPMPIDTWGY